MFHTIGQIIRVGIASLVATVNHDSPDNRRIARARSARHRKLRRARVQGADEGADETDVRFAARDGQLALRRCLRAHEIQSANARPRKGKPQAWCELETRALRPAPFGWLRWLSTHNRQRSPPPMLQASANGHRWRHRLAHNHASSLLSRAWRRSTS